MKITTKRLKQIIKEELAKLEEMPMAAGMVDDYASRIADNDNPCGELKAALDMLKSRPGFSGPAQDAIMEKMKEFGCGTQPQMENKVRNKKQ